LYEEGLVLSIVYVRARMGEAGDNLYQRLRERSSVVPRAQENPHKLPASGIYTKDSLSYEDIMSAILKISKGSTGAIATYVGRVRPPGFAGRKIKELVIEADHKHSDKTLLQICDEVKKKFGLQLAVIYLYEGSFRVGELLVMVAVAGKGRSDVFSALDEVTRRFVHESHIRKKEVYEDGGFEWME
jgi:molybdopterin synthase catalytic subunit